MITTDLWASTIGLGAAGRQLESRSSNAPCDLPVAVECRGNQGAQKGPRSMQMQEPSILAACTRTARARGTLGKEPHNPQHHTLSTLESPLASSERRSSDPGNQPQTLNHTSTISIQIPQPCLALAAWCCTRNGGSTLSPGYLRANDTDCRLALTDC